MLFYQKVAKIYQEKLEKKEYINENKTICQDDCIFYNYNYTIKKSKLFL